MIKSSERVEKLFSKKSTVTYKEISVKFRNFTLIVWTHWIIYGLLQVYEFVK